MKKGCYSVCGAVLLLALATAPALAKDVISDTLLCGAFDDEGNFILGKGTGSAKVDKKTGDLTLSLKKVAEKTDVNCFLQCVFEASFTPFIPCGTTDNKGKLKKTVEGFANRDSLGSDTCTGQFFNVADIDSGGMMIACFQGFKVPK